MDVEAKKFPMDGSQELSQSKNEKVSPIKKIVKNYLKHQKNPKKHTKKKIIKQEKPKKNKKMKKSQNEITCRMIVIKYRGARKKNHKINQKNTKNNKT